MNLTSFLNDGIDRKKTIRILVYPNITFSKDLTKDSYVQVITNMIAELNNIRDDLFFYLVLPEYLECLDFPNTKQYFIKVPTYPPTMRSHFDVFEFKKIVGHDIDIDLVFSHLPEHTHQVKNVISNVTHHSPAYFGYSHWFDLNEVVAWSYPSFNQNLLGILEMDRCYINTQSQKDLVLNQATKIFNRDTIETLDEILTVQHLGVRRKDINRSVVPYRKTIVFNHRPETYKDYKNFMSIIKELRKQRQDFNVWVPLLEKSTESWITTEKFDKNGYYKKLSECCVGFSPKQLYGGWSVSTTDGLMNGCPFIMYDADYYHELNPTADFFSDNGEAITLMHQYLDDPTYRAFKSVESMSYLEENMIYEDEITIMSEHIDYMMCRLKSTETEVTEKLINLIRENGFMTKKELFGEHLGWGRGIKYGPYRRALLNHPNIYDTLSPQPEYCWID